MKTSWIIFFEYSEEHFTKMKQIFLICLLFLFLCSCGSLKKDSIDTAFFSKNLSSSEKNKICSPNFQTNKNIDINDLPREEWNRHTIEAIGCIKPYDEKIHLALTKLVSSDSLNKRRTASNALISINPQSRKVHQALTNFLNYDDKDVAIKAIAVLIHINDKNKNIHKTLVKLLIDKDEEVVKKTIQMIKDVNPRREKKIHLELIRLLNHKSENVIIKAASALKSISPQDEELHLSIAKFLKYKKRKIVIKAASLVLGEIKPKNENIHLALLNLLNHGSEDVVEAAVQALNKIKPRSEKVYLALSEFLNYKSKNIISATLLILGYMKFKGENITLNKNLKHEDELTIGKFISEQPAPASLQPLLKRCGYIVDVAILYILKPLSVNIRRGVETLFDIDENKEIHLALIKLLKNHKNKYVIEGAAHALNYLKPKNEKIQLTLVKLASHKNLHTKRAAISTLINIGPKNKKVLAMIKKDKPLLYKIIKYSPKKPAIQNDLKALIPVVKK